MFRAFAVAALALASGPAQAITFEFWGDQVHPIHNLQGSFEASDENGDGFITSDEVSSFNAQLISSWWAGPHVSADRFGIRYELYSGILTDLWFERNTTYSCTYPYYINPSDQSGTYSRGGSVSLRNGFTSYSIWGQPDPRSDEHPPDSCLRYIGADTEARNVRQTVHVTGEGPRPVIAPVPLPAGLALMAAGGLVLAAGAGARRRRRRADLS